MNETLLKLIQKKSTSNNNVINTYIDYIIACEPEIENYLTKVKRDKLFDGKIHGEFHSEKVLMYSIILGHQMNLNEVDMRILMDAAYYHDMGRTNNFEDQLHGYVSAINIDKAVKDNPIYKDPINLGILKASVDMHCLDDSRLMTSSFLENGTEDNRFLMIAKILKDADALDRKRFVSSCDAALDESMLRFKESKKLIPLAIAINKYYSENMDNYTDGYTKTISKKDTQELDCFHSIGFDFFKISSIMNNGILSSHEMKKHNIDVPRNFLGGNGTKWISVVDVRKMSNESGAFNEFTKHGIGFYCVVPFLQQAETIGNMYNAIEQGLPYNKSGYEDEMYVSRQIEPKNILAAIIPAQYKNNSIRSLNYIYNSLEEDTIKGRIEYYMDKTGHNEGIEDNPQLMSKLNDYLQIIKTFNEAAPAAREAIKSKIPVLLDKKREGINSIIAEWIYKYYSEKLNKKYVTVADVVAYELSDYINFSSNAINDVDTEMVILLNSPQKEFQDTHQLVKDC